MGHGKLSVALLGSIWAGLLASGCCQQEKQQMEGLNRDLQTALNENKEFRNQLGAANTREAQLVRDGEGKDRLLADKDTELAGYKRILNDPNFSPGETAAGWQKTLFGDKVTVGGDLLFAPGQATLTAAGKTRLDQIVRDIQKSYPGRIIRVYGYTDTDPIRRSPWKDNLELSGNRAMAVTRHLISKGIKASLVETVAMGEHHPLPSGKAASRRVEVFAVRSK